jgi:hypothetical protein
MNAYDTLRQHARDERDRAIAAARDHYADTLDQIGRLQARNGKRFDSSTYVDTEIRRDDAGAPFSELTLTEAAERILRDNEPMRLTQLILEIQQRGCRRGDNPRRIASSLRSAFRYHKNRFILDRQHRWRLV